MADDTIPRPTPPDKEVKQTTTNHALRARRAVNSIELKQRNSEQTPSTRRAREPKPIELKRGTQE